MHDGSAEHLVFDAPAEGVARVTFNRPERYNAFTFGMYRELLTWLQAVQYDTDVRVVVVTGAGKGFCSGHDLGADKMPSWASPGVSDVHRDMYAMQLIRRIPLAMRAMPQPVIAAVNGAVAGIGWMFALAADVAVAGSSARFVNAFHNVGIGSEGGISYLLPRAVGGQRAAELLLTGRPVGADEAAEIGLVLDTVADDELMGRVLALADAMILNTPLDNWLTKQAMHANADATSFAQALDLDTRGVVLARTTEDTAERRQASADGRRPHYRHR